MPLENLFSCRDALKRFRVTPLGPEMDGFSEWLCEQGFCRGAMRRRVWEVSHFNQYLQRQGVKNCREIKKDLAERFIREHLPRCRCRGQPRRKHVGVPRSVRCFLAYLSERDLLAPSAEVPAPQQGILEEFLDYLKGERNLAEKTIEQHRRYLAPLLEDLGVDADRKRLSKLTPEQVQALFAKYTQDSAPTIGRLIQATLRTFLRFSLQQGYLKRDLTQAVPKIRRYKLSTVPRGLSDEDTQKVLESIDRATAVGLRDFAILQLLDSYGVRGGQIRALKLQDIRWRHNQIRFRALKGGKPVLQPLTDQAGEALLEYLRQGRPQSAYPEVFLTARAPRHPLRCACTVSMIVASRLRQAGVSGSPKGSHVFRHAFAGRMLNRGQSIKTIADMLGHRDLNTTFIYTKVDLHRLQQLPLEWPEV
ncbi:MAG: site-specific integrase [Acidobacteriota bacterium]